MSGFLHQLANRSLGLAPQVRSRAALPYAAPAADYSMTEAASHDSLSVGAAIEPSGFETPQSVPSRPLVTDSPLPAPVVAENIPRADRLAAPTSSPAHKTAIQPPRITSQQADQISQRDIAHHHQAERAGSNPVASQPTSNQKSLTQEPVSAAEARQPAESPRAALADIESLVARLLGNDQGHPENSPEIATPPTIVTARQTAQRPAEISAIRPQSTRERAAVVPEADTAPEVHITIGRLEVNPPNRPAPAAQPPRPRGPTPMSLTEYLARRNGGRS